MDDNMQDFFVETVFGAKTRQPLVRLLLNRKQLALMSPEDAIALAMNLLQASQASLSDAFLFSFAEKGIGLSEAEASNLMNAFRQWRQGRDVDI